MNELAMDNNKKMSFRLPKFKNFSLRELNKNEKGLTLIELLAVIVILAIIAAIAIPSIGGIIKNSQKNATRANAHMIIDAARFWVTSEGVTTGSKSLQLLKDEGYLENIPTDALKKPAKYSATASEVTVGADPATGNLTYSIKLADSAGTFYYFGSATAGLAESDVDDTTKLNVP